MKKIGIALILLVLGLTLPSNAEIYLYVDSDGVIQPDKKRKALPDRNIAKRKHFYPHRYDSYIQAASGKYGVAFALIKAVIKTESDFNPRAVSPKGALGLMQIMPENIKRLEIQNPFDPAENIMGGARHFKSLSDHFAGDLSLSLAAYNAGIKPVERCQCIPPFKETRDYVKKVLDYYEELKK
jgi:soluble lytic murein transglycosylase